MNILSPRGTGDEQESGGTVQGVAVGIVTDNKDPAKLGRVRLRFPWRSDKQESHWARIAVPMAGNGRGSWFLPEVGDEVLVAFDRGDPGHPYVVGALWNGQDRPPETNADGRNDRRVLRSRKGHLLAFDDGAQPSLEVSLAGGKRLRMDDRGISIEDGRGNRIAIASDSGGMTLEATGQLTLKATRIAIEATGTMAVRATSDLAINGLPVRIN